MAQSRIVAQGTALVVWRLQARSSPGSRKWRTLYTAVAAFGALLQCSFPQHTFFEEDCFNGKDDDGNGKVDCEDSVCQGKVACLEAVPSWHGPVAVWRGPSTQVPPDCSLPGYGPVATADVYYEGEVHQEVDASACPPCVCTPGTPRCTSRLVLYDKCDPGGVELASAHVSSNCATVPIPSGLPMSGSYLAKAEAPVVTDACVSKTPQSAFPAPLADYKIKFCDAVTRPCGEHRCVAYPSAPFGNAFCIYAPGQLACPESYPIAEYAYEAVEGRQCSSCSCTASGISCPPDAATVGDYGASSDCTGSQRYAIPTNVPCAKIGVPVTSPLHFAFLKNSSGEPIGNAYCTPSTRTVSGSVTKGPGVTVCCAAAPSGG